MDSDSEPEMLPCDPESQNNLVLCTPFNFQDPSATSSVSQAVLRGNLEEVKSLLENGKKGNSPDNNGNIPLHLAVLANREDIVELLLPISNIDYKNYEGYTPLLLGLQYDKSEQVLMSLISAGADVCTKNAMNETALHKSVKGSLLDVTEELIKRGADIDAQDVNFYTPLIQAVQCNNLDSVCLLLYYNADVTITCLHRLTPFMYAVNNDEGYEIAKILLDYYDDFNSMTCDGYTPLLLAANSKNPLAIDLVKYGVDVNFSSTDGYTSLYLSLYFDDSELFKEIWTRLDFEKMQKYNIKFLHAFMVNKTFSTNSWLECLYLILNSKLVEDMLTPPVSMLERHKSPISLYNVFKAFYLKGVPLDDRITILYILLSFGYIVTLTDITLIYYLYGYKDEIQILINHNDIDDRNSLIYYHPLPTFFLYLERDYSVNFISALIENQMKATTFCPDRNIKEVLVLKSFRFFSIPYAEKIQLLNGMCFTNTEILEKTLRIPEIPSLVEICRNKFRFHLKNTCKFNRSYQFHNFIKQLQIVDVIKDILTFKRPIY